MVDPFEDLFGANARYAESFSLGGLSGQAARGLAVVTCIDSRIEPLPMLGLVAGDAKILRNAGARVTDDVLRSLVLATNLLGVHRIAIVAHTDCAAAGTTEAEVRAALSKLHPADQVEKRRYLVTNDQRATLVSDFARIREEPLIPASVALVGLRYDVATGRLEQLVSDVATS